MSRRNDPTALMWAQACEILAQADRMHQQFFRLTSQARTQATWEPPADVFESEHEILVVVALPGVAADRVDVSSEGNALLVRAERPHPFRGSGLAVRQVEIPYGYFERRIALPPVPLELVSHELNDGCLMLRLRKRGARNP
ncbi:MAG TPA: Hsp20/alpha crystallin family protein [Usitatibacter sp.]|nr:Hsp20/alpha crystallin family protein [Usitatibacter sp.]